MTKPTASANHIVGAIMISGRGSNMKALVEAAKADDFPVRFSVVLSDQPQCAGLAWAREYGLTTQVVDPLDAKGITDCLERVGAELVCLAGYMRVLPPEFCERWSGRCLNIHPSLLPKHKGLNAQTQALCAGDAMAGATVHWVSAELDSGVNIMQRQVPVLEGDTVDELSNRILAVEHQIYPRAVKQVALQLLKSPLT